MDNVIQLIMMNVVQLIESVFTDSQRSMLGPWKVADEFNSELDREALRAVIPSSENWYGEFPNWDKIAREILGRKFHNAWWYEAPKDLTDAEMERLNNYFTEKYREYCWNEVEFIIIHHWHPKEEDKYGNIKRASHYAKMLPKKYLVDRINTSRRIFIPLKDIMSNLGI